MVSRPSCGRIEPFIGQSKFNGALELANFATYLFVVLGLDHDHCLPSVLRLEMAAPPLSGEEIARKYLNALRGMADSAPVSIGDRKLKRKTTPPFDRPEWLLKTEIL